MLVDYMIKVLIDSDLPCYLDFIVTSYLIDIESIDEDSSEFDSLYRKYLSTIKRYISNQNNRVKECGFDGETIVYVTPDKTAITRGGYFNLIVKSKQLNLEDPNRFADRIAYEVLRKFKCRKEDIYITPDSNDGGIDFLGVVQHNIESDHIAYEVKIVGQVKKYQSKVSVKDIREFIGSIRIMELRELSNQIPIIKVFISTSELTKGAKELVDLNNILVLSKYHLLEMGIF